MMPADWRRQWALIMLAGGGMAMTVLAGFAMWTLAKLNAVWPTAYMGFGCLALIAVVLTGFAGLLVKRQVKGNAGSFASFEVTDSGAVEDAATVTTTTKQGPGL